MTLLDFVKNYSEFGYHRTGSQAQLATEKWLTDVLHKCSDKLSGFSYTYPHFDFNSTVMIEDRLIQSLPVYYESTDKICGTQAILAETLNITEDEDEAHTRIKAITTGAKANGYQAVVLATTGIVNSLYALNVTPVLKNNLPIILVPGFELQALDNGQVHLDYMASVYQRSGQNIVARFGAQRSRRPVVITTPMSGWFNCAGERGAGLALAIELAKQLGATVAVELILTSGHELGFLGGYQYANSIESPPSAVIHIGSCVGADNASLGAWYNDCGLDFSSMVPIMNKFNILNTLVTKTDSTESWVGEAQCWAKFGCPMISIAGINPLFHTPDDQWQVAVTDDSLQNMFSVLAQVGAQVSRAQRSC